MRDFKHLNTTLVLGFFDGIHLGHQKVLNSAVEFAKKNDSKTVLLTFKTSPSEYFNISPEYIYNRKQNYNLIESLGIDYIEEYEFSELVNQSAHFYLQSIVEKYNPIAIFTGYNYTFGYQRQGNSEFLTTNENKYGYKYFCIPKCEYESETVSSTLIRNLLKTGNIPKANLLLSKNFFFEATVIEGAKIGRTIGFPTANMLYPKDIVNLPYGVYCVRTMNKLAVMNWGIKPTVKGATPLLEVHIPQFNNNLYGKNLRIEIIKKIRDEIKFDNLEELRKQIEKDIKECLKS